MAAFAQQTVGLGIVPNDDTGDALLVGGGKINNNFDELFRAMTVEAGGPNAVTYDGLGNAIFSAGVSFSGDAAVAANLLDDYEEGTFTPVIDGTSGTGTIVHTNQIGTYTKIGDLVTCIGRVSTSSIAARGGITTINGFPFLSASVGNASGIIGEATGLGIQLGTQPMLLLNVSSTLATVNVFDVVTGVSTMDLAVEFTDDGNLKFQISYKVA